MPIVFSNLAGFWALLAVPAILLIHFLQKQSVRLPASTLFLLQKLQKESVHGQKFERLRNSIPLWLQLLIALLLTWILVQPRVQRENTVQRIAVVIDSSASMGAFTKQVSDELASQLPSIVSGAALTEITLIESHGSGDSLYHGSDLAEMLAKLSDWKPEQSAHDPAAALRIARSIADQKGLVIFVSDHEYIDPSYGAKVLAVGEAIDNVGFAGLIVDTDKSEPSWRVTVKNYSATPQEREWFLTSGNQRTEPRQITLDANETRMLEGKFPNAKNEVVLQLKPDRFTDDDQIPILIPTPKQLTLKRINSVDLRPIFDTVAGTLDNTRPPNTDEFPDLIFFPYNPTSPTARSGTGIVFIDQKKPPKDFSRDQLLRQITHLLLDLIGKVLSPDLRPAFRWIHWTLRSCGKVIEPSFSCEKMSRISGWCSISKSLLPTRHGCPHSSF